MFQPPRCPNRSCSQHLAPRGRFFIRRGAYHPKCRPRPVPRFRCRYCGREFSRQTFRADYRDHRPHLNAQVFLSLASGVGLRQTARTVGLTRRNLAMKARKIGRHLRRFNLNLRGQLPVSSILVFDELETYEGRRNTRPLTVPIIVDRESRFVIWAESAPIRPHGRMSEAREKAIQADERRFGPRQDLSQRAIERTLARAASMVEALPDVFLRTDEKAVYPKLAREAFGEGRLVHTRTNSKVVRDTWNPLFAINHTEAIARDLMGRLRRDSWLVSKRRRYLDIALHLWMAYVNYVRRRFNRDAFSPAQRLGFAKRRMRPTELLSWRQDWGRDSIHPLSMGSASVGQVARASRAGA